MIVSSWNENYPCQNDVTVALAQAATAAAVCAIVMVASAKRGRRA
jgi:hypothetical protein